MVGPLESATRPRNGARIVVFTKNLTNENYAAARFGANQAGNRLGVQVSFQTPTIPDSSRQQIDMLRATIKTKPDAIIISVADDAALEPEIKRVVVAEIPLISIVNRASPLGASVTFIGADDEAMGYAIARYLFTALGGRGYIVLLAGPPTAPTSRQRVVGVHRALKEFPDVKLLAAVNGQFQREPSYEVMKTLMARFPIIDGVVSANDLGSLGAIQAMEEAQCTAKVVSINGIVEAAAAVRDGRMLATMDYNAFIMGCLSLEAAVRHLHGDQLPKEILLPTALINANNYQTYLLPVEQRTCPCWESQGT